jgi:hypothetical protein
MRTSMEPVAVEYVTNRAAGVALPRWEGGRFCSLAETRAGLARPELPLPRLLAAEPHPGFKLEAAAGALNLTSDREIVATDPDRRFLARWWVNGEPYVPESSTPEPERLLDGFGRLITAKRVRLHLDFDPARIGARQGDRVGIQLLYVDGGWELVDRHHLRLAAHGEDGLVLLSNRAEWVVTSDSKGRPRLDPLPPRGKAPGDDSSRGRDTPEG